MLPALFYKLTSENRDLLATNRELVAANRDLTTTNRDLISTNRDLSATNQQLLLRNCNLERDAVSNIDKLIFNVTCVSFFYTM